MQKSAEPLTEDAFRVAYDYRADPKPNYWKLCKQECLCTKETPQNLFPIVRWLPKYNIKSDLLGDIISGITVAIMHIPHGLAYSQLGGVPPVIGLYMAVFPQVIYVLMGTSRHISIGTFAVLCAMVGDIVVKEMMSKVSEDPVVIASCVAFMVGIWQILLALLRLGALTVYMSHALVSGFTTGAAVHVFTYQLGNVFGINVDRFAGPLKLIYTYISIFQNIHDTNFVTLGISLSFITFLIIFYYGIKPVMHKKLPKCKVPVPIELISVIIGIIISYFLELEKNYGTKIVKEVPKGLPVPKLPDWSIVLNVIIASFPVAVVGLSINLSLAKIFAKKDDYKIFSLQEILAYGMGNFFSSFFQCMPSAASLSRTVIQYNSGGKTQLATVFSMIILILILLFIGPLFEPIPYCVLSSIVVVTIFSMILQIRDLPAIYRLSYLDGTVWVITFVSVVIIDIDYGLLIGFIASIGTILLLNHKPQIFELGKVSDKDLYLDFQHFEASSKIPNIVIVRIIGGWNFSNLGWIQKRIQEKMNELMDDVEVKYIGAVILDFSAVTYIDPTSAKSLVILSKDIKKMNHHLLIAACNVKVYGTLSRSGVFSEFPAEKVFATVDDAVLYAKKKEELV